MTRKARKSALLSMALSLSAMGTPCSFAAPAVQPSHPQGIILLKQAFEQLDPTSQRALLALNHQQALKPVFPRSTYLPQEKPAIQTYRLLRYYYVDSDRAQSDADMVLLLKRFANNAQVEAMALLPAVPSSTQPQPSSEDPIHGDNDAFEMDCLAKNCQAKQHYLDGHSPAPGYQMGGLNVKPVWALPGGTGKNVRVVIMDVGLWGHPNLPPKAFVALDFPEGLPSTEDRKDEFSSHATSVAGIIFAQKRSFGTIGIAYEAQGGGVKFGVYRNTGDAVGLAQFARLAPLLKPGDLINISYTTGMAREAACKGPFEGADIYQDVIRYLTDVKGVTTVIGAANDGKSLDSEKCPNFNRMLSDTGAFYVGAIDPITAKRADYSNFGARVDFHAWGNNLVAPAVKIDKNGSEDPRDFIPAYNDNFGMTSGATPQVTGAAAVIQSLAIERNGIPLSPRKLRRLLADTGNHPTPGIGVMPDVAAAATALATLPVLSFGDFEIPHRLTKPELLNEDIGRGNAGDWYVPQGRMSLHKTTMDAKPVRAVELHSSCESTPCTGALEQTLTVKHGKAISVSFFASAKPVATCPSQAPQTLSVQVVTRPTNKVLVSHLVQRDPKTVSSGKPAWGKETINFTVPTTGQELIALRFQTQDPRDSCGVWITQVQATQSP